MSLSSSNNGVVTQLIAQYVLALDDLLTVMLDGDVDHVKKVVGKWSEYLQDRAGRTDETLHPEILECKRFLASRWREKTSLEDAARHLYLHPNYLSRLFRRETGQTFIGYVTDIKIKKAMELLERTSYSVQKIAEMLAYENKNYFTRLFKAHTGFLPSAYRANIRKRRE